MVKKKKAVKRKTAKKAVKKKKTVKRKPAKRKPAKRKAVPKRRKAAKKKTVKRKTIKKQTKKKVKKKATKKTRKKAVKKVKKAVKKTRTAKKKTAKEDKDSDFEDIPELGDGTPADIPQKKADASSIDEVPQKKKGFFKRLFKRKEAKKEPEPEEKPEEPEPEEKPEPEEEPKEPEKEEPEEQEPEEKVVKKKAVKKATKRKHLKKVEKKKPVSDIDAFFAPDDELLSEPESRQATMLGVPSGESITKAAVIQTGVDRLVGLIKERHRVSIKEATRELGLAKDVVGEWADFLEAEGVIFIEHSFLASYMIDRAYSKEARKQLAGEVGKQKEIISRKLEGSITGLQRDAEEIRLVQDEFEELHDYVKDNFSQLHEDFMALSEFHDAYEQIRAQKKNLENKYKPRLREVDDTLDKERMEYQRTMSLLTARIKKSSVHRRKLLELRSKETLIERKITELAGVLDVLHGKTVDELAEIAKSEKIIDHDEKRMRQIKDNVSDEGEEIKKIYGELGKARIELQDAEKTFMSKVSKISKMKIPKKDVIIKGTTIVAKIKNFLAEASHIREALHELKKDRVELERSYRILIKRTVALSASAKKAETPLYQWEALDKERETTDKLRTKLATDLKALRKKVRKLVK